MQALPPIFQCWQALEEAGLNGRVKSNSQRQPKLAFLFITLTSGMRGSSAIEHLLRGLMHFFMILLPDRMSPTNPDSLNVNIVRALLYGVRPPVGRAPDWHALQSSVEVSSHLYTRHKTVFTGDEQKHPNSSELQSDVGPCF